MEAKADGEAKAGRLTFRGECSEEPQTQVTLRLHEAQCLLTLLFRAEPKASPRYTGSLPVLFNPLIYIGRKVSAKTMLKVLLRGRRGGGMCMEPQRGVSPMSTVWFNLAQNNRGGFLRSMASAWLGVCSFLVQELDKCVH